MSLKDKTPELLITVLFCSPKLNTTVVPDPNITTSLPTISSTTEPDQVPESPEVEQHSSMTIFFILLVVGKSYGIKTQAYMFNELQLINVVLSAI